MEQLQTDETIEQILERRDRDELLGLFTFDRHTPIDELLLQFDLWTTFFFPKFLESEDAPFHLDIDINNAKIFRGEIESFTDIAFRGAAKTTRTKLFFAFWIANDLDRSRRYLKINSEDSANAKQAVTDIYNLLIDPRMLWLYPEIFQKTDYKREETMKSFTTATGIKLTADSVGTDQRGDIQEENRPDVIWFDDFETKKTLRSAVITKSIWDNMAEARDGLAKNGACIYTCNYISERGNVHKLVERKSDLDVVMITPIHDEAGKATWPARYTDEEARRMVEKAEDGAGEYLCKPSASKDVLFNRERIDKEVKRVPIKSVAGFRMYAKYDASHRYGAGQDVAGGVGLDSSTNVIIDFSTFPAKVVGVFDDNEVKPDTFGHEIARQNAEFGECLTAPENNKFDMAIGVLKQIYPTERIYRMRPDDDKVDQNGKKLLPTYGWNTNALTKPKMILAFAKAYNDGLVELSDPALIAECRSYTRNDLMDTEVDPRLTTRHFDIFTAACIAWQLKDLAEVAPVKEEEPEEQQDEALYPDIGV